MKVCDACETTLCMSRIACFHRCVTLVILFINLPHARLHPLSFLASMLPGSQIAAGTCRNAGAALATCLGKPLYAFPYGMVISSPALMFLCALMDTHHLLLFLSHVGFVPAFSLAFALSNGA